MTVPLVEDLRQEIAGGRVVCVVGAGVSIAATGGGPSSVASWKGLLENGVAECVKLYQNLPHRWEARAREDIASDDLDDMIGAAEKITRKLGGPAGGDYVRWLREALSPLRIVNREVPEALKVLSDAGVPLFTTNYDGILEEATDLLPITWRNSSEVERVLRGDERAIVHLHGYWKEPASVVLDIRSYERVLANEAAQAMQRALRTMKTLLFVGFGAGLSDPNFKALLAWSRSVFAGSQSRHFRLARQQDVANVQHEPEERIFTISYGSDYKDLAPFLRSLAPSGKAGPPAPAAAALGESLNATSFRGPRFFPNRLNCRVSRDERPFHAHVVEPREYDPSVSAALFEATLGHFVNPFQQYVNGPLAAVPHGPSPRFDLIVFPEGFLHDEALLSTLKKLSASPPPMGCVHVGLRPSGHDRTHLFEARAVSTFLEQLRQVPGICTDDLRQFSSCIERQPAQRKLNIGCLFTIDSERQIRVCLHAKFVRSPRTDPLQETDMLEADLVSLVTLRPEDATLSSLTMQPLLSSDLLPRSTSRPNNHPLEALNASAVHLGADLPDQVDVVSVPLCTIQQVLPPRGTGASGDVEWRMEYRRAFVRAAEEDACQRQNQAIFVLANYRNPRPGADGKSGSQDRAPGGLSGAFFPLPVCEAALHPSILVVTCARAAGGGDVKWDSNADASGHGDVRLGNIISLPYDCQEDMPARILSFTLDRLPREANRWSDNGKLTDCYVTDVARVIDNGQPSFNFIRRDAK